LGWKTVRQGTGVLKNKQEKREYRKKQEEREPGPITVRGRESKKTKGRLKQDMQRSRLVAGQCAGEGGGEGNRSRAAHEKRGPNAFAKNDSKGEISWPMKNQQGGKVSKRQVKNKKNRNVGSGEI